MGIVVGTVNEDKLFGFGIVVLRKGLLDNGPVLTSDGNVTDSDSTGRLPREGGYQAGWVEGWHAEQGWACYGDGSRNGLEVMPHLHPFLVAHCAGDCTKFGALHGNVFTRVATADDKYFLT